MNRLAVVLEAPVLKGLFLGLVFAHTLQALFHNLRERKGSRAKNAQDIEQSPSTTPSPDKPQPPRRRSLIGLAIQAPLFAIAYYFAYQCGAFSRELVSPVHIGLGLVAGHLIFGLSLLITLHSLSSAWEHFIDLGALWDYACESPVVLGRFILVAFAEELVWRVGVQPIAVQELRRAGVAFLGVSGAFWGVTAAVVLVAVLFSVAHRHFFQNSAVVSLEFVGFAILLGVLYHITASFILVIVVHALRDIEIAYLEYLIKVEELGDKELAAREVEKSVLKYPRPENP